MGELGEIVFSRSPSINNIQAVSNFYGLNSEMLSSEKSIFENYDCGGPCQRKNAAVMVRPCIKMVSMTFYLFYIKLPPSWPQFLQLRVLLKGLSASFATWDKISTTKERKYAKKGKYANKTMQNDMQMIIDIFGSRSNRSSYMF